MLLGSFDLLADDPSGVFRLTVLIVFALLTAVTIPEFSHALVANSLGDNTARRLGRLSLNPMRHLDPGGAIMMFIAGFGWGKPVPVDPRQLSHGYTGTALVAAAGPLSNLVFAFLLAIPFKTGVLVPASLSLDRVVHVMTGGLREGIADVLAVVIFSIFCWGYSTYCPWPRWTARECWPVWCRANILPPTADYNAMAPESWWPSSCSILPWTWAYCGGSSAR